MLICCCNSAYKILGERNLEIKEEIISSFLNEYFTEESEIDYKCLLNWCYKVDLVDQFFGIIKKEVPKKKRLYQRLNLQNIGSEKEKGHWCDNYRKVLLDKEKIM